MKPVNSDFAARCSVAIDRLYFPVAVLFFLVLASHHFKLITYPFPLDYNEPSAQTITATIASLENPYSIQNQPARTSVYPVLYNMLVAPLSLLFGNTLQLHRSVTGFFILCSCVLVYFTALRVSHSARDSFAAAILFYAGLLFYATPVASTSSLGLFLFLSSLLVPWYYRFSNRSLGFALVLGVLAFYGKQYFVACLGYLALFLFLTVSKIKGVIFGILSSICFIATLAAAHYAAPYFLDIAVFSGSVMKFLASNETMLTQLRDYGLVTLPLWVILLIQSIASFSARPATAPSGTPPPARFIRLNLKDLSAPLLSRPPDYFWYCLACSLTIIVLILGKNPGNYLSYFFQLISPFLVVVALASVSRAVKFKAVCQLLIFVAFCASYAILSHDFAVRKPGNWKKLEQTIAGANKIYATPIILGKILENGGEIYQNGHTVYFFFALDKPASMLRDNPEETARHLWAKYLDKIYSMISTQSFDLVILDKWTKIPPPLPGTYDVTDGSEWLRKYYRLRETIPLHLAERRGGGLFKVQIWEPIPKSSLGNTTVQ